MPWSNGQLDLPASWVGVRIEAGEAGRPGTSAVRDGRPRGGIRTARAPGIVQGSLRQPGHWGMLSRILPWPVDCAAVHTRRVAGGRVGM